MKLIHILAGGDLPKSPAASWKISLGGAHGENFPRAQNAGERLLNDRFIEM